LPRIVTKMLRRFLAPLLVCARLLVAHAAGDFYRDLGVRRTATVREIKDAYREAAKKCAPPHAKKCLPRAPAACNPIGTEL
jgi:uncharacterized protein YaiI (UPF0178 family)